MCSKVSSILVVQHVERDFLFEQPYTNGSVCDGFIQICKIQESMHILFYMSL